MDLNAIAVELIENPEDSIEFEVFFEQGEFETAIPVNAQGRRTGICNYTSIS